MDGDSTFTRSWFVGVDLGAPSAGALGLPGDAAADDRGGADVVKRGDFLGISGWRKVWFFSDHFSNGLV